MMVILVMIMSDEVKIRPFVVSMLLISGQIIVTVVVCIFVIGLVLALL
jgi:hypothetical protein